MALYLPFAFGMSPRAPIAANFNPKNATGLSLWLDATDNSTLTLSGSNVNQWRDKSGNGNNATGISSPIVSKNSINGLQSIYTNNGPYFTGPMPITGTTLTCFAVATTLVALPKVANDQRLVSLENGPNVDYGREDGVIALFNQSGTSSITTWRVAGSPVASATISTGVPFMAVSQYDGSTGYLWENGSPGSPPSNSSSGTFAITKYGIGNQPNNSGEYWIGNIGEVIIYNTSLSTSDRQKVEGYLAWKWAMNTNLPSTHPYRYIQP